MKELEKEAEFCIEIQYDKATSNPGRLFQTISELIYSFQTLDVELAKTISAEIKPVLILQEVEIGSIRTWFSSFIKDIDDESIGNLNYKAIIGKFLIKGKYQLLKLLGDNSSIDDAKINELQGNIQQLAFDTQVKRIPSYEKVSRNCLLDFYLTATRSLSLLSENDNAEFISGCGNIILPKKYVISEEVIDDILVKSKETSELNMILTIKKPDYLGISKWLFQYNGHPMEAKIEDEEWLKTFHERKVVLKPGDALKALVRSELLHRHDCQEVTQRHTVLKVLDIISGDDCQQLDLFKHE